MNEAIEGIRAACHVVGYLPGHEPKETPTVTGYGSALRVRILTDDECKARGIDPDKARAARERRAAQAAMRQHDPDRAAYVETIERIAESAVALGSAGWAVIG